MVYQPTKISESLELFVGKFVEQVAVLIDKTICELLSSSGPIFGVG